MFENFYYVWIKWKEERNDGHMDIRNIYVRIIINAIEDVENNKNHRNR